MARANKDEAQSQIEPEAPSVVDTESAPVHRPVDAAAGDVTNGGTLDPEQYDRDYHTGALNAGLQPVRTAMQEGERVEVEVQLTGPQPSGPLDPAMPHEATAKTERVIQDERPATDVAPVKINLLLEEADDPDINRLNNIAGRRLTIIRGDGKARSHGFQTLVAVDTFEQVRVFPGAIIPDGRWVNVSYLPEAFLASLRDR